MKIRSERADLFHQDGHTDRHDEANIRFSQFFFLSNAPQNEKDFSKLKLIVYRITIILSAL